MLVDPRPYTYEYRKPRFSNPTLYLPIHSANPAIFMAASTIITPPRPTIISHLPLPCAISQVRDYPNSTDLRHSNEPKLTFLSWIITKCLVSIISRKLPCEQKTPKEITKVLNCLPSGKIKIFLGFKAIFDQLSIPNLITICLYKRGKASSVSEYTRANRITSI